MGLGGGVSCLDGLGGVLLANEHLDQTQLGFDPLVLLVLLQHGHTVLLLNSPGGRERETEEERGTHSKLTDEGYSTLTLEPRSLKIISTSKIFSNCWRER